jgi:DNA-binding XRE family transcriptional regulator
MNRKLMSPSGPFIKELLKDPEVRFYYEQERAKTELAMAMKAARTRAKLTQAALAKKAGTTQSVVARLEGGRDSRMPSLPLLGRLAQACGGFFEVRIQFKAPLPKA